MYVKLVLALTVFCVVISRTKSEKSYDGRPYTQQGYTRIKRGKYYSSPPQRFHSRPPVSFPRGAFSYTPPPNYSADDEEVQYPGPPGSNSRPPKVSKRPTHDSLGDDDINNIVKYLSKQDLDKIIDLAGGRDKDSDRYSKDPFEKQIKYSRPPKDDTRSTNSGFDFKSANGGIQDFNSEKYSFQELKDDESKLFKALVQEIDTDQKYSIPYQESKQPSAEITKPSKPSVNFVTQPTPYQTYFADSQHNQLYDPAALEAEESMLQKQIAYLKSQINDGVVYTDSKLMPEENLPKPMNLREHHDFDVSYTNKVPTIVKAEQGSSYKLENFGELPLMNYNSKLDTLSSYHVPHYTVTSDSKPSSSSYSIPSSYSAPSPYGGKVPSVEAAPPPSAAKGQSDAHLKAVRIWSHKSKGTAYTLHDDGSLSLEKPGRPRGSYGHP